MRVCISNFKHRFQQIKLSGENYTGQKHLLKNKQLIPISNLFIAMAQNNRRIYNMKIGI